MGWPVAVTIDQSEGQCLIRLDGEVGIACAGELKNVMLQALASGKDLQVDLQRATDLDVTAMQLLWAAEREARKSGQRCFLVGQAPKEIIAAAGEAGFEKFLVPSNEK
jgi:anti-anti-sigma regulatory factor